MTTSPPPPPLSPRDSRWWLRPRVALPLLGLLLLAAVLLTPEPRAGRQGDSRLTTYSTSPQGAGALYELASRLGWHVGRSLERMPSLGTDSIRAILSPVQPLTGSEAHAALEHVRRGGALLLVLGAGGALEDSLGIDRRRFGAFTPVVPDSSGVTHAERCDDTRGPINVWPTRMPYVFGLRWRGGAPAGMVTFAEARLDEDDAAAGDSTPADSASARSERAEADADTTPSRPAAVGYPLGGGRVVIVSDPDMLRNDVLRVCAWDADIVAVRMLEYLASGATRRAAIVFDEYHQGFGAHPGSIRAMARYLSRTGSGRTLLQLAIAGLVLLAAAAPRPLPPRDDSRVERRSPLEHVDALARAYRQVHATRTAAQRLLRGVRRRAEGRVRAAVRTDDEFLHAVEARHPELADEIGVVRRAIREPVSGLDLERTGAALERIESSLTTTRT